MSTSGHFPNPGKQELADLLRQRAIRRTEEPFQLSTGAWSRDFVDLRGTLAAGRSLALAAGAIIDTLKAAHVRYDVIGGPTMGADPLAHAVAVLAGISWFSIRKQEKRPGSGRLIEGAAIGPGCRLVLIDDTVSSGQSIVRATEVARGRRAEVAAACTLLDRGNQLGPALAERSIRYLPVLTYADLGLDAV